MKLVIHELNASPLSQVMVPKKNTSVVAIRPHLYRHNFATGTLKLQIYNGVTLVAESSYLNISDIGMDNFFHGYVRFDVDAYLQHDIPYTFKLVSGGGYSFSEGSYIGWCTDFDLAKYQHDNTPPSNLSYPFDLEVWERKTK